LILTLPCTCDDAAHFLGSHACRTAAGKRGPFVPGTAGRTERRRRGTATRAHAVGRDHATARRNGFGRTSIITASGTRTPSTATIYGRAGTAATQVGIRVASRFPAS